MKKLYFFLMIGFLWGTANATVNTQAKTVNPKIADIGYWYGDDGTCIQKNRRASHE